LVRRAFWRAGLVAAGAAAQGFFRTGRVHRGYEIKTGPWFCVSGGAVVLAAEVGEWDPLR
jgi:hypothetical protein